MRLNKNEKFSEYSISEGILTIRGNPLYRYIQNPTKTQIETVEQLLAITHVKDPCRRVPLLTHKSYPFPFSVFDSSGLRLPPGASGNKETWS